MLAYYNPPYDSPIEDAFAYNIIKYIADDVEIIPQMSVNTICGCFILDFVFKSSSIGIVAVECDGQEFHEESRDEWRDAMILGADAVDVIYRIRGSDIIYYINDVLYCIACLEPKIMSDRVK